MSCSTCVIRKCWIFKTGRASEKRSLLHLRHPRHISGSQPCARCQNNLRVSNLHFLALNNGWRNLMNPWANGLYSCLSAHVLQTHRPFSWPFCYTRFKCTLCPCISISPSQCAHRLTARRRMAKLPNVTTAGFQRLQFLMNQNNNTSNRKVFFFFFKCSSAVCDMNNWIGFQVWRCSKCSSHHIDHLQNAAAFFLFFFCFLLLSPCSADQQRKKVERIVMQYAMIWETRFKRDQGFMELCS